jgi:ORF6N domain
MSSEPTRPAPIQPPSHGLALVRVAGASRPILLVRGHKVMLDADLATLYGVETRALVQAVKRNLARFPDDFMFQLSFDEATNLRSQSVISSCRRHPRTHGRPGHDQEKNRLSLGIAYQASGTATARTRGVGVWGPLRLRINLGGGLRSMLPFGWCRPLR